jgi:hypothetical protein
MPRLLGILCTVAAVGSVPAAATTLVPAQMPETPLRVPVAALAEAPAVDGDLAEWGDAGWVTVATRPAVEDDEKNRLGAVDVRLRVGVHGDRFYLAARWPDRRADTRYKPWEWRGDRYRRGKRLDDMFAARRRHLAAGHHPFPRRRRRVHRAAGQDRLHQEEA